MADSTYVHIEVRSGVPYLEGTQTKVIEVALDSIAQGWSPEEIHFQHPHLSLGQVHGALAYHHDHKEEIERDIERRYQEAEALRARFPARFTRKELEDRLRDRTQRSGRG